MWREHAWFIVPSVAQKIQTTPKCALSVGRPYIPEQSQLGDTSVDAKRSASDSPGVAQSRE